MFGRMRRIFLLLALCAACLPLSLKADDRAAEAAARAQREEAEERYKLLSGKIENALETQELLLRKQDKLQQRINALASELDELKRTQVRAGASSVTQDQLKELVEKLQEIDRKRIADNEHVLTVLRDLQKMPAVAVPPASDKSSSPTAQQPLGPFWEYIVKTNDTLKKIVIGYNNAPETRSLARLTVADVLRANPGLNQDKLYVGKKILIPIPPKKEEKTVKGKANSG